MPSTVLICPNCGAIHKGEHEFFCDIDNEDPLPEGLILEILPRRGLGAGAMMGCVGTRPEKDPVEWAYIG